jgi:DNA polymerase
VLLAGEQPGDEEDRQGRPFVGPAGRVLSQALEEAGVDGSLVYVTNVVKHFRWRPSGKRRLHQKPSRGQIEACRPWLEQEIVAVEPALMVCLGATAAQAVFGPSFRIGPHRGAILPTDLGPPALVTVHPSSVLREPDEAARHDARAALVRDLRALGDYLNR